MKRMATPNGYHKRKALYYLKKAGEFTLVIAGVILLASAESIVDNLLKYFGY